MLEEGEIDGDEEFTTPIEQQNNNHEFETNNHKSKKSSRKQKSSSHDSDNNNYDSGNESGAIKSNKKRKKNKRKLLNENDLEGAIAVEDLMNESNFNSYECESGSGDVDERFNFQTQNNNIYLSQNPLNQHINNPIQKTPLIQEPHSQPASLIDLFKYNPSLLNENAPINPVITEKENSKPNKAKKTLLGQPLPLLGTTQLSLPAQNTNQNLSAGEKKRKVLLSTPDESEMTISVESLEKKIEKKMKYAEIQKEKQKKEQEMKKQKEEQMKQVVCHFFLEGRCTKGDKCPFGHMQQPGNSVNPIGKKYDICKFYLNGYCAKNDKCTFLHSEFPCKFYHKNILTGLTNYAPGPCSNGDKCRFSHEQITNPLLKESFEKYLKETGVTLQTNTSSEPLTFSQHQTSTKVPLLGVPQALNIQNINYDSLASLNKKAHLLAASSGPLLPSPPSFQPSQQNSPPNSATFFGDVDFRTAPTQPKSNVSTTGDVDFRKSPPSSSQQRPLLPSPPQLPKQEAQRVATDDLSESKYEEIKKELIIKIMKAIADDDGGIFSQIPKQTLTDLLVKLLNSNFKSVDMGIDTIIALLATITAATSSSSTSNAKMQSSAPQDNDLRQTSLLNLGGVNEYNATSTTPLSPDYDDDKFFQIQENYNQEDEDYDLVIQGYVGEFEYKLIEIDVEPSILWSQMSKMYPTNDYLSLDTSSTNLDQEIDPRIKYYSNKANLNNVNNYHNQIREQQLKQISADTALSSQKDQLYNHTPTSPNSSIKQAQKVQNSSSNSTSTSTITTSPAFTLPKAKTADPRLNKNLSINQTLSTSSQNQSENGSNDLLSIQTRQLNAATNSLLSSLPDVQLPKDLQRSLNNYLSGSNNYNQQDSSISNNNNNNYNNNQTVNSTVKLSIADYKRKLQKPSTNNNNIVGSSSLSSSQNESISSQSYSSSFNSLSELSNPVSLLESLNSNKTSNNNSINNSQSDYNSNGDGTGASSSILPAIPTYSFNLGAPQSLHELLKNFQS